MGNLAENAPPRREDGYGEGGADGYAPWGSRYREGALGRVSGGAAERVWAAFLGYILVYVYRAYSSRFTSYHSKKKKEAALIL